MELWFPLVLPTWAYFHSEVGKELLNKTTLLITAASKGSAALLPLASLHLEG